MMRVAAAALLSLCCSAAAQAGIMFEEGNNPQPDEENILLNTGDSGATIFGETNQSGISVQFSSTLDVLVAPSSGQARIEAEDGLLNNITISIPNGSFLDFIGNPFDGEGEATITVVANELDGTTTDHVFEMDLGNGQNFFTVFAIDGETIASITIDAPDGFSDLRQPRISGATVIPEPVTLAMFFGVGALTLGRRRFKLMARR